MSKARPHPGQPDENPPRTCDAPRTMHRPFRVLGVQQIALGGLDRKRLRGLWVDLLGLAPHSTFRSEKENVDEEILTLGRGLGEVELDLMQPIDPEKSPKVHLPPLNHLGLWIDDLKKAVEFL